VNIEEIALIAQKISFAFEDFYFNKEKRDLFNALFNRYLSSVDPSGSMEPYDAIILLARKDPGQFDLMVQEMKEFSLISG
jgi:hypothetical protein